MVLVPLVSTTLAPEVSQLPLAVQVLEESAMVMVPAVAVTSTVANDAMFCVAVPEPLLASHVTLSPEPGVHWHFAPPEEVDQCVPWLNDPVPPIQKHVPPEHTAAVLIDTSTTGSEGSIVNVTLLDAVVPVVKSTESLTTSKCVPSETVTLMAMVIAFEPVALSVHLKSEFAVHVVTAEMVNVSLAPRVTVQPVAVAAPTRLPVTVSTPLRPLAPTVRLLLFRVRLLLVLIVAALSTLIAEFMVTVPAMVRL